MTDNVFDLSPINGAQYWEAQADMWRQNYEDEHKELLCAQARLFETLTELSSEKESYDEEVLFQRGEIEELRSMLLEFVKDPLHQLRMTDTGAFGPHFVLVTKDHVYKVREKLGIPTDIPRPDQETVDKYWDEKIAADGLKETDNDA